MKVLALVTQKGGSGKSTLAASLAGAAAQEGETVLIVDLDPQASLMKWASRRAEPCGVRVVAAKPKDLAALLASQPEGLVILDTPGLAGPEIAAAVEAADLCLLPVRPTVTDIDAVLRTVEMLKRMEKPYVAVLSQCNATSAARTVEAATVLAGLTPLSPAMIVSRADYLDADTHGQGVTEYNATGKAAGEIRLLWTWIKRELSNGKAKKKGAGRRPERATDRGATPPGPGASKPRGAPGTRH